MKTKIAFLTCALAALFFSARAAHAAVIMTLEQVGPDVVATASGTADLTDLTLDNTFTGTPDLYPMRAYLQEGAPNLVSLYSRISGPTSFGTGFNSSVSSATGDELAIVGIYHEIYVPAGYVSGSPLSSTATWDNTTLAALGVTTGTYTWTWGSGADADSLTLYAGVPVPTPEPAPALLLTLGAAAFALWRRIKK